MIINVETLEAEIERLSKAGVHFRNDIATGPGGFSHLLWAGEFDEKILVS